METEKNLTEEESLKLISRTIYEAKGYFYENGFAAMVYGFAILLCSCLAYLRDTNAINIPFHPFYLFIPVFFVQAVIQLKQEKKKKAKTFTDETIDFVWMGFFLSVIVAFASAFANLGYITVSIILILTAFAAFLTGMISKFKYHIICSFGCWLAAIFSFFILNANIWLLLGLVAIFVWIIPGFILNAHFKKLYHS